MLVTRHGVMVSVNVVLVETLVYNANLSVTVTVWVPIVAALLVETDISPAEVIVNAAEVNAV